jgi:hypothetical protein
VRKPRPGLPWSLWRVQRRVDYAAWISSPDWLARRRVWHQQWTARHESAPVCQICSRPWSLRDGALHHRSYQRLGHEADRDLVPLCREPCHRVLHQILESNPAWLKAGRPHATDTIVALLRAHRTEGGTSP